MTGRDWVDQTMVKVAEKEDEIYASIGAYDPEAFASYLQNERDRLSQIARELTASGYDWNIAYPFGNLDHKPPQPEAEEPFVYGMHREGNPAYDNE